MKDFLFFDFTVPPDAKPTLLSSDNRSHHDCRTIPSHRRPPPLPSPPGLVTSLAPAAPAVSIPVAQCIASIVSNSPTIARFQHLNIRTFIVRRLASSIGSTSGPLAPLCCVSIAKRICLESRAALPAYTIALLGYCIVLAA